MVMANIRTCRYCGVPSSSKRRICLACFNKHNSNGIAASRRQQRRPCLPTRARPGSAEKLEVLCQRAATGQELFHPQDARM